MSLLEQALSDPASLFKHPLDVLKANNLSKEDKIRVLKQWEYDAREMAVAEEENMMGENDNPLPEILDALHQLGVHGDPEDGGSTKHGA